MTNKERKLKIMNEAIRYALQVAKKKGNTAEAMLIGIDYAMSAIGDQMIDNFTKEDMREVNALFIFNLTLTAYQKKENA